MTPVAAAVRFLVGMRSLRGRTVLTVVGLLVSLGFAYFAVRDVDLDALKTARRTSNLWTLLPAGLILAVAVFLRAVRWRMLLSPAYRPSMRVVTTAVIIGYLFNTILPARAGEAARVVVLKQRAATPRFEAVGTIVAERAVDVLCLLTLFFAAAPLVPQTEWVPRTLLLGGVVFAALTLSMVAFALYGERPARLVLRPLTALPRISRERTHAGAANLVRGLALFRRPRVALPACALTLASWLLIAFSSWIVLRGFDLELGLEAAVLVVVATNLAMILPSGPASVGVFQAATIVALAAFGVDRATALSYGIVLHALSALPFIPAGYVALHYHAAALRRGDVRSAGEHASVTDAGVPSAR